MKKCKNCGRMEYDDTAIFCTDCGGRLEKLQQKKGGIKWVIIGGCAAVFLCAAVAGGFFLKSYLSVGESLLSDSEYQLKGLEEVENYEMPDMPETIDLYADNHEPSARDLSAVWDKTLFYWLEDTDDASDDDNHIAFCLLSRMSLYREDNENRIDYEVYRDEDSGEIYKIVSIERQEEGTLELTDYYYDNGSPNFIFRRYDSVYTPTYASIDQVGERYYFNQDQMVKWRWIYEPQVVKQWVLSLDDTRYTQWAYPDISQAEREEYDAKEREMLNAAYNTYDAVKGVKDTDVVFGVVTDSKGNPLSQADVAIGTLEDGQLFAKLKTDEDGRYAWLAEDRDEEYFLVFQAEGMEPSALEPGAFGEDGFRGEQEPMVLYEKSNDTYTAQLSVRQIEEKEEYLGDDGNRDEGLPAVGGAEVEIRAGINRRSGEALASGETDESGAASFDLKPGVYTAVIRKEGLSDTLWTFRVDDDMKTEACMVKAGGENSQGWTAVLTWNKDKAGDLDSTLFTPQKSTGGNMSYINTLNRQDGFGNRYLYDSTGTSSCEVIQIAAPEQGSYRYYVNDYKGCLSGGGEGEGGKLSGRLSQSEAVVTLYKDGQFVCRFYLPRDEEGVIWEVFEIQNGRVVPIQTMYGSAEGKEWWIEDKELAHVNDEILHGDWIQSDGEWLYFVNPLDNNRPYYCRKDGSNLTKISDDSLLNDMVLVGNRLNYVGSTENGWDGVSVKTDGTDKRSMNKGPIALEEIPCMLGVRGDLLYSWSPVDDTSGSSGYSTLQMIFNTADREDSFIGRLELDAKYIFPQLCYGDGSYYYAYPENQNSYYPHLESGNSYFAKASEDGTTEQILGSAPGICTHMALKKGWLYFNTDMGSYRMKADGSGLPMEWDNSQIFNEEERVEIGGEYYGKDLKVYDANGNFIREMFDTKTFIEAAAMEAYKELLSDYVPQTGDMELEYSNLSFAALDINGDGIKELLIKYILSPGCGTMDIYRYDLGYLYTMPMKRQIFADSVYFNSSNGCFATHGTYHGETNFYVWKADGNTISEVQSYYLNPDFGGYGVYGDEEYLQLLNTYFLKPKLYFAENTAENRNTYLASGVEARFVEDEKEVEWLLSLLDERLRKNFQQ